MTDEIPGRDPSIQRPGYYLASHDVPWNARFRVASVWLLSFVASTLLLVAPLPFSGQVTLKVGDVAAADVVAARQATYVSAVETQRRRDAAANSVPDVYDPPQARIARQQLNQANQILAFIASVRSDSYTDRIVKAGYLSRIKGLELPPAMIERVVDLPSPAWDHAAEEIQSVLDQAMREEIRENSLADERRKVPARVRLDLPDDDAAIVSYIVENLLAPNSFYNASKTEERRQLARDGVEPATSTIERNEIILRAGDIVTSADLEALNALGLKRAALDWQQVAATGAVLALLGIVLLYYLWREEPELWLDETQVGVLPAVFLLFTLFARLLVPAHALLSYVFPYAALAMLISVLVNQRVALISAFVFTMFIGWLSGGNIELMAYSFAASMLGTLKLRRADHLSRFAWACLFVVYADMLVGIGFRLATGLLDPRGFAELVAAAVANGFVVLAVGLSGTWILGTLFGITTPLQLMEISRPTHPLLRQLLLKAPGTYHHTLLVSNMAERAAESIGADAQLARVGAYFHDVGKSIRPYFFGENRAEGQDPHAVLDPYTSAQIIVRHVRDGVELARKYRLPRRVIDFIPEHHGTQLVSYFYYQAVKQAGSPDKVDPGQFTYPGPRPCSRETAITMLADAAEATVRAKHPSSSDEISRIVAESIQSRMASGQLDDCPLTLSDLQVIQRAFVDVLRGIHHPRISYPTETRGANITAQPPETSGTEVSHETTTTQDITPRAA